MLQPTVTSTTTKVGRNQFKCFHCRLVFGQKDGNWFDWDQMQVHLCRTCDKLTTHRNERSYSKN